MNRKHRRKNRQGVLSYGSSRSIWHRKNFGRILSEAEQIWCNCNYIHQGFDLDSEKVQHSHLVQYLKPPSRTKNSIVPICGARTLWFVIGEFVLPSAGDKTLVEEDNRISCVACLDILARMIKKGSVFV